MGVSHRSRDVLFDDLLLQEVLIIASCILPSHSTSEAPSILTLGLISLSSLILVISSLFLYYNYYSLPFLWQQFAIFAHFLSPQGMRRERDGCFWRRLVLGTEERREITGPSYQDIERRRRRSGNIKKAGDRKYKEGEDPQRNFSLFPSFQRNFLPWSFAVCLPERGETSPAAKFWSATLISFFLFPDFVSALWTSPAVVAGSWFSSLAPTPPLTYICLAKISGAPCSVPPYLWSRHSRIEELKGKGAVRIFKTSTPKTFRRHVIMMDYRLLFMF